YLPGSDPVHKVSIIPTTKGALGYTMQMPTEDQYLVTENELKTRMAVMLGGRAAELLVFDEPTTGASNDLERATETARRMVIEFGMSTELGPVRYAAPTMMYLGGAVQIREDAGESTAERIDAEIRRLVTEAQEQATKILKEHEKVLHEVANTLQKKEVINNDEIQEIVNREKEEQEISGQESQNEN
ncbi:MAG: cell division protein FtsH, partial [Synergistaceae bacterium]|nr:cell division protein FtsH [Synergistaceae bacterium]